MASSGITPPSSCASSPHQYNRRGSVHASYCGYFWISLPPAISPGRSVTSLYARTTSACSRHLPRKEVAPLGLHTPPSTCPLLYVLGFERPLRLLPQHETLPRLCRCPSSCHLSHKTFKLSASPIVVQTVPALLHKREAMGASQFVSKSQEVATRDGIRRCQDSATMKNLELSHRRLKASSWGCWESASPKLPRYKLVREP